jgi:flavin reductase (DIM6/NTAB) family NADH-FMN oxidoreductase RutF
MSMLETLMPAQAAPELTAADFRSAMRNVPGAVSIVTTGRRPDRFGLTLTAGCSLSTEPSRVLVCVNKSAGAHDTIKDSRVLCWNILSSDHTALAQMFSGQNGVKGDGRFADGMWQELVTGAPSLIEAPSSFDCHVVEAYDAGSHTIFVGEVVAQTTNADCQPLVYVRGSYAMPRAFEPH